MISERWLKFEFIGHVYENGFIQYLQFEKENHTHPIQSAEGIESTILKNWNKSEKKCLLKLQNKEKRMLFSVKEGKKVIVTVRKVFFVNK